MDFDELLDELVDWLLVWWDDRRAWREYQEWLASQRPRSFEEAHERFMSDVGAPIRMRSPGGVVLGNFNTFATIGLREEMLKRPDIIAFRDGSGYARVTDNGLVPV